MMGPFEKRGIGHTNRFTRKKGLIFSFDALLALGVAVLILGGIFLFMQGSRESYPSIDRLALFALDIGAVSEMDGSLSLLAGGNSTSQKVYLDSIPNPQCIQVTLLNSAGGALEIVNKTGCSIPKDSSIGVGRRIFLHNDIIYMAVTRAWYS